MGNLTEIQKSIVTGSILGDGYLRIIPGRTNAILEINHSIKQKDYVDWLFQQLKNLIITPPKLRRGNGKRIAYRFFTRQHPELSEIYNEFYVNGRKLVPKDLKLDPISLAVWFMDDGSKSYRTFYLNTQRFDQESQNHLIEKLRIMGIKSSLNKDKIYFRIRISGSDSKKFCDTIKPYIIESMKYKLG